MLQKIIKQVTLVFNKKCQHPESQQYQEKYEKINQRLIENPQILDAVHTDLEKMGVSSGKSSTYSSDMILRMLLVKHIESLSWRDTIVRIELDMALRTFVGAGFCGDTPTFTYLCGANKFINESTWKIVNDLLLQDAINREEVSGEKLRVDTTLCETNIHYPTDSHLLWDSFRVLTSIIKKLKRQCPSIALKNRFHDKKVKKLYTYISRNAGSPSTKTKQKVKKSYNSLIEQVKRASEASKTCVVICSLNGIDNNGLIEQLQHYLPIVDEVVSQTDLRINHNVKLPADAKVYSIFEEHTELIKRGKAGRPIEYGHMVMIAQTGEKFISDYEIMKVKRPDKNLVDPLLENHKQKFGFYPEQFAGDKGFHESPVKTEELEEKVELVCIPKKGKRTVKQLMKEHSDEFKEAQKFRAGSEGSISTLKRAFGMKRSLLRTFNTFAANIGCMAFCYNLVLLSKM